MKLAAMALLLFASSPTFAQGLMSDQSARLADGSEITIGQTVYFPGEYGPFKGSYKVEALDRASGKAILDGHHGQRGVPVALQDLSPRVDSINGFKVGNQVVSQDHQALTVQELYKNGVVLLTSKGTQATFYRTLAQIKHMPALADKMLRLPDGKLLKVGDTVYFSGGQGSYPGAYKVLGLDAKTGEAMLDGHGEVPVSTKSLKAISMPSPGSSHERAAEQAGWRTQRINEGEVEVDPRLSTDDDGREVIREGF